MAYCKNCGSEISDFANNCPECGAPQEKAQQQNYQQQRSSVSAPDNGGFGWGLLGFCIPIVGIVLYFVWQNERPRTAKVLLQGALISIAINILGSILFGCTGALMGA